MRDKSAIVRLEKEIVLQCEGSFRDTVGMCKDVSFYVYPAQLTWVEMH